MAKNHYVTFGDILIDKSTGISYAAVNAGEAINKNKRFLLCLELNQNLECFLKPPVPFNRADIREFNIVKNDENNIRQFMVGTKIKFDSSSVRSLGFISKK